MSYYKAQLSQPTVIFTCLRHSQAKQPVLAPFISLTSWNLEMLPISSQYVDYLEQPWGCFVVHLLFAAIISLHRYSHELCLMSPDMSLVALASGFNGA